MRVVVVGGGLSGLFTAIELTSAGIDDLIVVDGSARPGGVAQTVERDGFMLEPAAGSLTLPHPHLSPILERIGAEMTEVAGDARYVYVGERLVELPRSPRALLAPLLPWWSKLRAAAEPLVGRPRSDEESLDEFCKRRFGHDAGEMAAWLMAAGVYAGDPEQLSAESAFPMLAALEADHGSVVKGVLRRRRDRPAGTPLPKPYVPRGGMGELARRAADSLGERFRASFAVESVRSEGSGWVVEGPEALRAEAVVIATRPEQASRLVGGDLGRHLERVSAAPVVVVGLGGSDGSVPDGFGALIGPGQSLATLGILFESSYAPERAPAGSWLLKVIAGGSTRPDVLHWEDERLIDEMRAEVNLVLGSDLEPSFIEVIRHADGVPQPEIGHVSWLARVDSLLSQRPGLHLTGWGYRGVGVPQLATDAARVRRALAG